MPDVKAMQAHALATLPVFYAQVEQTFAFLPATYHYLLHEQRVESSSFFPDARAQVIYLGDKVEVDIVWGFASAAIFVTLVELQLPGVSPSKRYGWGEVAGAARAIRLESLAAVRGHGDDPDFLLGDIDRVDGRSTNKRFKLLENNLSGVVDGLARATERYASDILRGDTSIFSEVMAYHTEKRRALGHW